MCGRFTLFSSPRELQQFFGTPPPSFEIQPSYNVAPTQKIPVIIQHEDGRHFKKRHWGLVPVWAKEKAIGCKMINARSETVTSKSAFRNAIKQRRCLIPANGFYEWFGKAGNKQPYYFHLPSGEPIAFAGLWGKPNAFMISSWWASSFTILISFLESNTFFLGILNSPLSGL
jgi:putative SOS response-associated peptidase YedK